MVQCTNLGKVAISVRLTIISVILLSGMSSSCLQKKSKQPRRILNPLPSQVDSGQGDLSNVILDVHPGQADHVDYRFCKGKECETLSLPNANNVPVDPGTTHMFARACETPDASTCGEWSEIPIEPAEAPADPSTDKSTPLSAIATGTALGVPLGLGLGAIVYLKIDSAISIRRLTKAGDDAADSLKAANAARIASPYLTNNTIPSPQKKMLAIFDLDETIGAGTYKGKPGEPPLKYGVRDAMLAVIASGHRIGIATANQNDVRSHLMVSFGMDPKDTDDVKLFDRWVKIEQPKFRLKITNISNIREIYKTSKAEMVENLIRRLASEEGFDPDLVAFFDDKPDYHQAVLAHQYPSDIASKPMIGVQVGDYKAPRKAFADADPLKQGEAVLASSTAKGATRATHPVYYNRHMELAKHAALDQQFLEGLIAASKAHGKRLLFSARSVDSIINRNIGKDQITTLNTTMPDSEAASQLRRLHRIAPQISNATMAAHLQRFKIKGSSKGAIGIFVNYYQKLEVDGKLPDEMKTPQMRQTLQQAINALK